MNTQARIVAVGIMLPNIVAIEVDPTFGELARDEAAQQNVATVETLAQLDAWEGRYHPPVTGKSGDYGRYIEAWEAERLRLAREAEETEDFIESKLDDEYHARGWW